MKKKKKSNDNKEKELSNLQNINNDNTEKGNKKKQEKDIKFKLYLKKLDKNITLTEKQLLYVNKINDNQITFCTGQAGTGKTISACYALLKLLFEDKINKIIFTKPIKESGDSLGFLPGDIKQKIEPYAESFVYTCQKLLSKDIVDFLFEHEFIENRPLSFMRGCTFDKCGLFLDEAENVTQKPFMLYITRFGKDSKMIIAGDISQSDIKEKDIFFGDIIKMLSNVKNISYHEFLREDIMRDKILIEITEIYEQWKSKNPL